MNGVSRPVGPGLRELVFGGGGANTLCWAVIFSVVGVAFVVAVFGDRRKGATADLVYGLLRSQVNVFLLVVVLGYLGGYSPWRGPSALLGFFIWASLYLRLLTIGLFCVLIAVVATVVAAKWRRLPRPTALGAIGMPLAILDQIFVVIVILAVFATYA